jgi:hypothetical protein
VVVVKPRRYVLFCGRVFEPILEKDVTRWHEFHLPKNDGIPERQLSRFANVRLPFDGGHVEAGLATSWARQGIPMAAYAQEIRKRYSNQRGRFLLRDRRRSHHVASVKPAAAISSPQFRQVSVQTGFEPPSSPRRWLRGSL